ncbi:MAG: ubiquinone/menaquinone biosynthesis methyltransferase [Thermodesulfobacteria bacterium]|nr:ubiquinone/menaquinone biosynthesis methyltransferase [Thermodesulfobacteriota bacterium]
MLPEGAEKKCYVREKFSRVTRRYDLVNTLGSFGLDHWWRYQAARELARFPGPILDLCAGTLTLAKEIVRQRPRLVMALDICWEMLAYGRLRLATHPALSFIRLLVGDAERLPFAAESFFGVSVAFGVRNLAHLERGLAEMVRVLKPGGKAVILEFSRPKAPLFAPVYRRYLRYFMPLLGGALTGDREAYEYLARSIAAFPEPEELAGLMREVGFSEVSYRPLTLGVVHLYTALKP